MATKFLVSVEDSLKNLNNNKDNAQFAKSLWLSNLLLLVVPVEEAMNVLKTMWEVKTGGKQQDYSSSA